MKALILLILMISCGKAPLFSGINESKEQPFTQATKASEQVFFNKETSYAIQWQERPKVGQKSSFKIKFWDTKSASILGPYKTLEKNLCVFLWMKMSDGSEHGSSPIERQKENDHYTIDHAYFIMPGLWSIYIRTTEDINHCKSSKNDNFLEESIVKITIN